jgi:hypothetical protein
MRWRVVLWVFGGRVIAVVGGKGLAAGYKLQAAGRMWSLARTLLAADLNGELVPLSVLVPWCRFSGGRVRYKHKTS